MRYLFSIAVIGLFLLGVIGLIGALNQDANVRVLADVSLIANPSSLDFGDAYPGETKIVNVTLTPGTSDVIVSVNITGDTILQNMKVNFWDGAGYIDFKGSSLPLTYSTPKLISASLIIPPATKQKSYSGQVVYTVNEAI